MADSKVSALSEVSVIDFSDDLYLVDNTGPTSYKVGTDRLGGLLTPSVCEGRLTLTSGTPVTTSDVTAASSLYFTPYHGNRIGVYDGTRWLLKTFSEITLSLTLTAAKAYDVFIDDDAATLTLGTAWTDDTTRAAALTTNNGIVLLNSDNTKRWIGTIYASGTNTTEDSAAKRYVWNAYNRVPRSMSTGVITDSHSYTTAAYREWNNGSGSIRLQWINGEGTMAQTFLQSYHRTTAAAYMSVGYDSTSTAIGIGAGTEITADQNATYGVAFSQMAGIGKHSFVPLEFGITSATFVQYQMTGWILG